MKIIHAITDAKLGPGFKVKVGRDAKSRCGKIASVVQTKADTTTSVMIDEDGNSFLGTTRPGHVTCKKCINLQTVGTIHARPSGTANAEERALAHANTAATRAARTVGRPKSGRIRADA